jgi:CheY-like chemotaxis protein
VFSDIIMPGGVSGFDLVRWMATHRPEIRVLLTSGYPDEVARSQTGAVRATRLLRKPYTRRELARTLREALDQPVRTSAAKT